MCAVRRGSGNGLFLSARELLGRPRPAPRGSQRSARRPSAKVATPGTTTGPKRHRSSASPSVSPSASAGSSVAPSASASTPAATASFAPAAAPSPRKCGTGASDAEAVQSGSTWTARRGDTVTYPGEDMAAVITSATASLGADRTSKQHVVVRGPGRAACPPPTSPSRARTARRSARRRAGRRSYTALDVPCVQGLPLGGLPVQRVDAGRCRRPSRTSAIWSAAVR